MIAWITLNGLRWFKWLNGSKRDWLYYAKRATHDHLRLSGKHQRSSLVCDPVIDEFHIIRERVTATDGYLRVKLALADGGMVECAEYVQRSAEGDLELVTYAHHWASANSELIMRWDNTPHFPDLPNFPDHVHDGRSGTVSSGVPMDIGMVLDEIARNI